MNKKGFKAIILISVLILIFALSGCTITDPEDFKNEYLQAFEIESRSNKTILTPTEAAEKVLPSVVGVMNYANSEDLSPQSEGSGVIMSDDGYIITNAHVIENAKTVKIVLSDGKIYTAANDKFWFDTYTDLGLIKISASGLTEAEFGNSDELRIAEDVLAIGNPGGIQYQSSVTKGIVSSTKRSYEPIANSGYVINCIQTDAAINPGNSGGALINLYGQVVGINSAKISNVDYEGMGFSITINEAKPIIEELMNGGYIKGRPALGIAGRLVSINALEQNQEKISTFTGIYIAEITNNDLINKEVKVKDIIIEVNGKSANSSEAVTAAIKGLKPGESVKIKYLRLGTYIEMQYFGYYNVVSYEKEVKLVEFKP